MNRCTSETVSRRPLLATLFTLALLATLFTLALLPVTSFAQNTLVRPFPPHALRGTMVVTQPPVITMDGKPAQLSPGARIKGQNNLLVMSGAIAGQELTVNYTVEQHGMVHDVWILTEAEAALKRKRAGE